MPHSFLKNIYRRLICHWLTLFWWALVSMFLFWPGGGLPSFSLKIPHLDKLIHFCLFFGIGFLYIRSRTLSFLKTNRRNYLRIAALAYLYSLVAEICQKYLLGRSADVWDVCANMAGLVSGILTYSWWIKRFLRRFSIRDTQ